MGYAQVIGIEQDEWEGDAVRPVIGAWYDEAALIEGYLPDGLQPFARWTIIVHWDGLDDIDPEKAARGRQIELERGQTSYPALYARAGRDYETEMNALAKALGLTPEEYRRRLADTLLVTWTAEKTGSTSPREPDNATAQTA